jgi:hypothetical protein
VAAVPGDVSPTPQKKGFEIHYYLFVLVTVRTTQKTSIRRQRFSTVDDKESTGMILLSIFVKIVNFLQLGFPQFQLETLKVKVQRDSKLLSVFP